MCESKGALPLLLTLPVALIRCVSGGSEVILVTSLCLYCCFPRVALRNVNDLASLHALIRVGQGLTLQRFLGHHGGRVRVTHLPGPDD